MDKAWSFFSVPSKAALFERTNEAQHPPSHRPHAPLSLFHQGAAAIIRGESSATRCDLVAGHTATVAVEGHFLVSLFSRHP